MKLQHKTKDITRLTLSQIMCVTYARLGYSLKLISKRTGLTMGQVNYCLHQWQTRLGDYRNGNTATSKRILEVVDADSMQLMNTIKAELAKQLPTTSPIPAMPPSLQLTQPQPQQQQ